MITRKSKLVQDLNKRYGHASKQVGRTKHTSDGQRKLCDKHMNDIKECSVFCTRLKLNDIPSSVKEESSSNINLKVFESSVKPKGNNVPIVDCIKSNEYSSMDDCGDLHHVLKAKTDTNEKKNLFSYSFVSEHSRSSNAFALDKTLQASRFYKSQKYLNPLERKNLVTVKSSVPEVKKKPLKRNKRKVVEPKKTQIKNRRGRKNKSPSLDTELKGIASDENACNISPVDASKQSLVSEVIKSDEQLCHPHVQRKFFTSRSSTVPEQKVFTTALAWKKGMHVIKSGSSISVKNTSCPQKHTYRFKSRPLLPPKPSHIVKLKSIENIPKIQIETVSSVKEDKDPELSTVPQIDMDLDISGNDLFADNPASEQVDKIDSLLASPEIHSEDNPLLEATALEKGNEMFYPVFDSKSSRKERKNKILSSTPKTKPFVVKVKQFIKETKNDGKEQMIIDAGQKEIGAKHCATCNMVYTVADAKDEKMHVKYHEKFLSNLKFPGWKKEHVLTEFYDGRVIMVTKDDKAYMLKKIDEILHIVNRDLGFPDLGFPKKPNATFLLFISSDKKVVGCLVAESITQASRVVLDLTSENAIPCSSNSHSETESDHPVGNWCSSSETVKAVCGINRIWTAASHRRQRIASRMMDCLRCNFLYGYVISNDELAFSDPSVHGREFAEAYTSTPNFLVYK